MDPSLTTSSLRLALFLARSGVASRRGAETMIERGEVAVNGSIITTPVFFVTPQDHVTVRGRPVVLLEKTRLFLYYKPVGLLVTHHDPQGRPTVFETLPPHLPRLMSVGRLDLNSEGLLLLCTNGALVRQLEHPSSQLKRVYRVRVHGRTPKTALSQLTQGITIDGVSYGPIDAHFETPSSPQASVASNRWLQMSLWEGKNREIRKVMAHFDLSVNRLIRTHYGPFTLGNLQSGQVIEVPETQIQLLGPSEYPSKTIA